MAASSGKSILYYPLGGLLIACAALLSLWGPEKGLLHDAHRAELERLVQGFGPPLARAVAQLDDLAKIDELRRLQKCPGVDSAQVTEGGHANASGIPLVWEGKTVGQLDIRLLRARWRLWRYRWIERALTLCVFFALAAGVLGFTMNRVLEKHQARIVQILRRQRVRLKRRGDADKRGADQDRKRWLGQAMGWSPQALLVLDGNQRIVWANPAAHEYFKLGPSGLGTHWLDHASSPEWAAALRLSIEHPEHRVPGPPTLDSKSIVLMSFHQNEKSVPESTWIAVS